MEESVQAAIVDAIDRSRARSSVALAAEEQIRSRAEHVLLTHGVPRAKARRIAGISRRTVARRAVRQARWAMHSRWGRRHRRLQWLPDRWPWTSPPPLRNGVRFPDERARAHANDVRAAVTELWLTATMQTGGWYCAWLGNSSKLIAEYAIPVPLDRQQRSRESDAAAVEYANARTGEHVLVYSFERWNGSHVLFDGELGPRRGHYRIAHIDASGQRTFAELQDYGLQEQDMRFGDGWAPPLPRDDEVLSTIVAAVERKLGVLATEWGIGSPTSRKLRRLRRAHVKRAGENEQPPRWIVEH